MLKRISRSDLAFPTFLIPKKDGRIRWISNFRKLNNLLKRARCFLPSIPSIMHRRARFLCVTKLDVSMGFYAFKLSEQAQQFCVISTPLGLYQYLRLPMGLINSQDIFQSVMYPFFSRYTCSRMVHQKRRCCKAVRMTHYLRGEPTTLCRLLRRLIIKISSICKMLPTIRTKQSFL